ncbi:MULTISPECIES: EamA family transporter [Arthrobacter]|uniref:EamA family transporter n=2 Tax=Arthrobacter TaxID=1663 RepID=A0ABU9KIC4_9MICC|nr:EamA family transporter [Arthrobacter sp. YJM1]MDP5226658.1 EamA family transporter [Arthrobacter sp. YJM1]
MKSRHVLAAVLVAVIWGSNFVAIRLGLHDVPPLVLTALRFALVAFPLMLFVPRPAVSWRVLLGVGLFMNAGHLGFSYLAMSLGLPTGLAPLILQSQVLFTILLAAVFLRERPGRVQLAGVLVGAAGLLVVVLSRASFAAFVPVLLTLAGGLCWGIGNVVSRAAKGVNPFGLVVWSAATVPLPLLILDMVQNGPEDPFRAVAAMTPLAWGSTLFTVLVSTLLAFTLWNGLLHAYPAWRVTPFALLIPVVGMTAGWLAFGEVPGVWDLAGGAVLLSGVAVTQLGGALSRTAGTTAASGLSRGPQPEVSEESVAGGSARRDAVTASTASPGTP